MEKACQNVAFIKAGQIVKSGETIKIIKECTSSSFKIIVSDSSKLFKIIENMDNLIRASISGVNSFTIKIEKDSIDRIQSEIERIAQTNGIEVYSFEKANTLEEAYKTIMNEESNQAAALPLGGVSSSLTPGASISSRQYLMIVLDGNNYKHSSGGEQSLRLVRMR